MNNHRRHAAAVRQGLADFHHQNNADFHYFMELAGAFRREGHTLIARHYIRQAQGCRYWTGTMLP